MTAAVPEPLGEVAGSTVAVPGLGCEVSRPGATVKVPAPTAKVRKPAAAALELDSSSSGGAATKMDSDSREGLIDGLRRC